MCRYIYIYTYTYIIIHYICTHTHIETSTMCKPKPALGLYHAEPRKGRVIWSRSQRCCDLSAGHSVVCSLIWLLCRMDWSCGTQPVGLIKVYCSGLVEVVRWSVVECRWQDKLLDSLVGNVVIVYDLVPGPWKLHIILCLQRGKKGWDVCDRHIYYYCCYYYLNI